MTSGGAVVIGGVNVDVLATPAARLAAGVSNPGRIRIAAGGAGRNVAENLARLRVSTRLIASAHAAALTDLAIAQAAQAGVDTSGVLRVPGGGNYYVAIEDAGAVRWAVSDMSAAEALIPADLEARASMIRTAAVVVVDANLQPASIMRAAELAEGRPLCLLPVSAAKAERMRRVLPRASLIALSAREAEVLTGLTIESPEDAVRAARTLRRGNGSILITMEARGLGWVGAEEVWIDAPPVAVRDSTGAGDAAAAVAIYALLTSMEAGWAARLAMIAAAMTLGVEGANHPGLSLEALHARA